MELIGCCFYHYTPLGRKYKDMLGSVVIWKHAEFSFIHLNTSSWKKIN